MKILHFCMQAPFTENYSYQDNLLTEYQHKHGHDVRIVTTTKTRGKDGRYTYTAPCHKMMDNGVELLRLQVKSRLRNAFGNYRGMLGQMIDYQPDLIFIHGLCSFIPKDAIRYKKEYRPGLHIVADSHQDAWTTDTEDPLSSAMMAAHRRGWKRWINDIDKVYATTSWRAAFAHKYYGIPYEKLDVLIMGIDEDSLPRDREGVRKELRRALGIPDRAFVFISGGKLDKNKHILEAMRAFSLISSADAYFVVFGSVSDDIQKEFFELCDADDRIRYLDYLDSKVIKKYLMSSDFGVFVGRHSVLWEEAVGCSLPCLFHRYEEKDHTNVCDNAVCIDTPDEDTIRGYMDKVLTDRVYYAQMKRNAEKAAKVFSYHTIAEKSVECCNEEHNDKF